MVQATHVLEFLAHAHASCMQTPSLSDALKYSSPRNFFRPLGLEVGQAALLLTQILEDSKDTAVGSQQPSCNRRGSDGVCVQEEEFFTSCARYHYYISLILHRYFLLKSLTSRACTVDYRVLTSRNKE